MATIQIPSGLSLFYREQGSGDKVILMVHGNLASSRWWERVMAGLPVGVRVLAPDLRGCGDSDKPEGLWSMADLAEDLHQFMQALGISRCAVVGHSLGGGLAQQFAVDHPEAVSHLVLINSAPPNGLQTPEAVLAKIEVWAGMPDVIKGALAPMMPAAPKDQFLADLLEDAAVKSNGAWVRNGRALNRMDVTAQVARLKVPTLVIYGQQDPLVTLAMAEQTRDLIPGAVLEVWPEVGHSPPVEAPERLAQRIAEFVVT